MEFLFCRNILTSSHTGVVLIQRATCLGLQYPYSLLLRHRSRKLLVKGYKIYWAEGDLTVAEERVREKLKFHGDYSDLLIENALHIIVSRLRLKVIYIPDGINIPGNASSRRTPAQTGPTE
jgi:hypothetical protein